MPQAGSRVARQEDSEHQTALKSLPAFQTLGYMCCNRNLGIPLRQEILRGHTYCHPSHTVTKQHQSFSPKFNYASYTTFLVTHNLD